MRWSALSLRESRSTRRYLQFLIVFEEQNGLAWKNVGLLGLLENRAMFG
jgi:hypothetical protein